nr:MAG TPA: hypothetical protein [Caudoviricetes sp.]
MEWAGVALCLVWRCAVLCTEFCGIGIYRHRQTLKLLYGPVNGLYGGFVFLPLPCPAGHGRKNAAC